MKDKELRRLVELKTELFIAELSQLNEQTRTQENSIIQARIFLAILFAYVFYLLITEFTKPTVMPLFMTALAGLIVLLSIYWYDKYVCELRKGVQNRVKTVRDQLLDLNKMDVANLEALRPFVDLEPMPYKRMGKLRLLREPQFEHKVIYWPLAVICLIVVLIRLILS